MPSLEQVQEWSDKLELNPAEVSHWFRCKWRIKLMSPLLQATPGQQQTKPPKTALVNGCEASNTKAAQETNNTSYSQTDSGSDGAQVAEHDDDFINIECETIVEEGEAEIVEKCVKSDNTGEAKEILSQEMEVS